jgi:WD40 repeat protein
MVITSALGLFHDSGCSGISQSYSIYEGLMSLPFPGHPNQYVMFHDRQDFYYKIIDVMYSIIDMNANNGLGKVIQKNQILMQDTLAWTLSAVKHANGRDWWVVAPELSKNSFYFFLLDPLGVHGPYKQTLPQPWFPEHNANHRSLFSPDGKQFVRLTHGNPAKFWLYDFDRCTGTLSNQRILSLPDESSIYNPCGAFSADSRYLYVTAFATELHQFDMQAGDIQASHQKIGEYDGFLDQFGRSTSMYSMALAPDGRIYMGGQSNTWNLHTIHRPERGGLNCDFRQHDVPLIKSVYENMPNLPNFRLYNEVGSSCDTLGVVAPMSAYWRYEQDTLAGPLEMDFTDMSYYQPVSWFWDFGDGSVGSTTHEPEHIFPAPGIYTVCHTACNALGVCDTLCRDIEILTVGSTNPITSASKLLSVYPNPASDKLWISHGDLGKEARFELYNATGLLVKKQALTQLSESEVVSIVNLPSGFYFWKLHKKEGKVESGKILVGR